MEQELRALIKDLKKPADREIEAVGDLIQSSQSKGIWLLAPEKLGIDQDHTVLVRGWDYYDAKPRGRRFVESSGIVVATRIESRETVAALVKLPKEGAPVKPKPVTEEIEDEDNLLTFRIALRDRLPDLPWRTGTYLVDVMLDGQQSNRLGFELTPGVSAERDPAIAEFIEKNRGSGTVVKTMLPPLVEGSKYPNYRKTAESPQLPGEVGIKLAPERVAVYTPTAQNVLQGSFRLPIPAAFYRDGVGNAPTAVVPITLVITGNDLVGPFVAPLRVATYDHIDPKNPETTVTGYFAIDLFALPETSKVVQTYTIWAYSGAARSEKVLAAVITPNMLK